MTTKFIVGAFVVLVLISLIIVGVLRGFNFGKPSTNTPSSSTRVNLPVVSNETTTIPSADSDSVGVKNHSNSELGVSFNYPGSSTITEKKVSPNNNFPYLGYEFALEGGSFGVFRAPHLAGKSLTDVLNGQNAIAQENGDAPAVFNIIDKKGNSFETAKFTSGSPSLYALRSSNNVYYVYLVPGAGDLSSQIDTIVNSFQLSDVSQTR